MIALTGRIALLALALREGGLTGRRPVGRFGRNTVTAAKSGPALMRRPVRSEARSAGSVRTANAR